MKRQLVLLATAIWLSCGVIPAFGGGEIVLANRYLQAQGTSHAQLFLYREDGTFLRQLTRDDSGQMIDPIFAPDGETIVFTREMGDHKDFWSIEPRGLNLRCDKRRDLLRRVDLSARTLSRCYFGAER